MSLDAAVIDLSVSMFDGPSSGGGKALSSCTCWLMAAAVGAETILAIDHGYVDYDWLAELTRLEVYLVTRMNDNAVYRRRTTAR